MQCPRCSSLTLEAGRAEELCPDCGRLLPPGAMADRLVTKLSELARFGLLDRAAPILKPSDGEDLA
jgi:hypothetical protein